MTVNKKHPMTFAMASRLLAKEYPDLAFSAVQLRRMAARNAIPSKEIPACGVKRTYYRAVYYPDLVAALKKFNRSAIHHA